MLDAQERPKRQIPLGPVDESEVELVKRLDNGGNLDPYYAQNHQRRGQDWISNQKDNFIDSFRAVIDLISLHLPQVKQ